MSNLLPNDQNDGYFRRLSYMAKIHLLQNGWFNPALRQTIHGRRVLDESKYFCFHTFNKSWWSWY